VILFCHITTHVDGDKDQDLLRAKGGNGFPYLVFLDAEGNVTARQDERTVASFAATAGKLAKVMELEARAKPGDVPAAADLLIAKLQLGSLDLMAARKALAALGTMDDVRQKTIDQELVNLEVDESMQTIRSQEDMEARQKTFAEMLAAGRVPTGVAARRFYSLVLSHAEKQRDAKLFAQALEGIEKSLPDPKQYARQLEEMHKKLDELKSGAAPAAKDAPKKDTAGSK
jgi:hypothetical protein